MNSCSCLSALKLKATEKKRQSIHPSLQNNDNGKATLTIDKCEQALSQNTNTLTYVIDWYIKTHA